MLVSRCKSNDGIIINSYRYRNLAVTLGPWSLRLSAAASAEGNLGVVGSKTDDSVSDDALTRSVRYWSSVNNGIGWHEQQETLWLKLVAENALLVNYI